MNLIREVNGKYKTVTFSTSDPDSNTVNASAMMAASTGIGGSVYPIDRNGGQSFLKTYYKVIAGKYPTSANDIILVVNKDNSVDINALKNLATQPKKAKRFNIKI